MANEPWKKGRPINWNCFDITINTKRTVVQTIITTKPKNQHITPAEKKQKLDNLIPPKGNDERFDLASHFSDKFGYHLSETWL